MSLSELLRSGLIEKFESDSAQIRNEAEIARTDLASAKRILGIGEWKWAYNVAYNAMLQAGRGLMFSKGYMPRGQEHHLAVVSFVQAVYASKFTPEVLQTFERARRRRSDATYDRPGTISESQARVVVEKAEIFVNTALELLRT